jgi:hypothetical protein
VMRLFLALLALLRAGRAAAGAGAEGSDHLSTGLSEGGPAASATRYGAGGGCGAGAGGAVGV